MGHEQKILAQRLPAMLPELERRYQALRARVTALADAEASEIDLAQLALAIGDMESLLNVLIPLVNGDEDGEQ